MTALSYNLAHAYVTALGCDPRVIQRLKELRNAES